MSKIVILSGAGLSAESGIPTFRDTGGLWEGVSMELVGTPLGWQRDPQFVLKFYAERFAQIRACQPNAGHRAIARLAAEREVISLTQNIDTLLEQAGVKDVYHLHGRIDRQKCEWHFSIPPLGADWQCDYQAELTDRPVQWGDQCPACGRQLRPDVVWFGEAVEMPVMELYEALPQTEVLIAVGTSAKINPAAHLLTFFGEVPHKYFIDPHPPEDLQGFTLLRGTAAEELPPLVDRLLAQTPSGNA